MTTFHVVYTPSTPAVLLPLALSLLKARGARFLLVDNGCPPQESQLIEQLAASEPRFGHYRLPFAEAVRHGAALDHLLGRCDEPSFAILDSDVVANGDFATELERRSAHAPAVCTGWPVWVADAEAVCDRSPAFLGGPYRLLADGTEVGGTACAIYDREALGAVLHDLPEGMGSQTADALPAELQTAFAERRWRFHRFGTARVAHLQLVLRGQRVINHASPHLHHLGGLSHVGDLDRRRVASKLLRGPRSPLVNLGANSAARLGGHGRARARAYRRKRRVVDYVTSLLEALADGKAPPHRIETGSAEVDARVRTLAEILIEDYPGYCERVRALGGEAGRAPVGVGR